MVFHSRSPTNRQSDIQPGPPWFLALRICCILDGKGEEKATTLCSGYRSRTHAKRLIMKPFCSTTLLSQMYAISPHIFLMKVRSFHPNHFVIRLPIANSGIGSILAIRGVWKLILPVDAYLPSSAMKDNAEPLLVWFAGKPASFMAVIDVFLLYSFLTQHKTLQSRCHINDSKLKANFSAVESSSWCW